MLQCLFGHCSAATETMKFHHSHREHREKQKKNSASVVISQAIGQDATLSVFAEFLAFQKVKNMPVWSIQQPVRMVVELCRSAPVPPLIPVPATHTNPSAASALQRQAVLTRP